MTEEDQQMLGKIIEEVVKVFTNKRGLVFVSNLEADAQGNISADTALVKKNVPDGLATELFMKSMISKKTSNGEG